MTIYKSPAMRLCSLAIIALVAAGCGGSRGSETPAGGAPTTTAGDAKAEASARAEAFTKGSVKLPAKGCGLLSDDVVTALLGGPPTSTSELRPPGVTPPGSVVGCVWTRAGGRQAGITLHQGPSAASDFADNTSGPASRPVPGLGDKAMIQVVAGQEEGSISVLKGDVEILVFGTLSGSADGYADTLKQAAAAILTHLGPG